MPIWLVFFIGGLLAFAVGMCMWARYQRDWTESVGLGVAAGGLVLLVGGIAMAPGWS